MKRNCENCVYSGKYDNDYVICQRYPPVKHYADVKGGHNDFVFPTVHKSLACGEVWTRLDESKQRRQGSTKSKEA